MPRQNPDTNIIALDIGDATIGVARGNIVARIPEPLQPFANNAKFVDNLNQLLKDQNTKTVVIGIPRNMSGEETGQSSKIRDFVQELKQKTGDVKYVFVDESLSSNRADEYLKNNKINASQDSVAACYILQEYFTINH